MRLFSRRSAGAPSAGTAPKGRGRPNAAGPVHTVLGTPLDSWQGRMAVGVFGMGCFWGVERLFWRMPGVHTTAAGYAGGFTIDPDYDDVCSGRTGHAEVVRVVFDPAAVGYDDLLRAFWENQDPTQGMRQHRDVGTQYRSVVYTTTQGQAVRALAARDAYAAALRDAGFGMPTTEIAPLGTFYLAEARHQQYLDKHPRGYCSMRGTVVACPIVGPALDPGVVAG